MKSNTYTRGDFPLKTINLVLGIHNHQPLGNFDWVVEEAYQKAYLPFLRTLKKYPAVKIAQHFTGTLLDWLTEQKPQFIRELRGMVQSGQVEMMGGAYYEAILSIIPDEDKAEQLALMNRATKRHFKTTPHGIWLAERVWEQHLAKPIAEAGLRYIVVDDTHFKYAGFADEELLGYYVTEEQGFKVDIFPISKKLRYEIPFGEVKDLIQYLRDLATEEGNRIVVYADDGEKFGIWPETFKHVYEDGWLDGFLKALSENSDWIKIVHFKDVLDTIPPLGRTYLPNASYAEMMHWALPVHHYGLYDEFERHLKDQGILETYGSFFKGGFWRNFLAKYPEANHMHKKMMRVSARGRALVQRSNHASTRRAARKAMNDVLAAQCNDPYWHGIFGGLYLPNLRYPIYRHLIKAESQFDRIEKNEGIRVQTVDFDCDGHREVIVESNVLSAYFKPDAGGALYELDFKPRSLNLLDIVSRKEEGYHEKLRKSVPVEHLVEGAVSIHDAVLSKEPDLDKALHYDSYRRGSLIEHFFESDVTLDSVAESRYRELGDFVGTPFRHHVRRDRKSVTIKFVRDGVVRSRERDQRIRLEKAITMTEDRGDLIINYRLRNLEQSPVDLLFGMECNVGLQAGDAPDRFYYAPDRHLEDARLRSMGELSNLSMIGLRDEWLGVDVRYRVDKPATFWRYPVETISLSEAGFERIFQSSVILPHWQIRLTTDWRVQVVQTIRIIGKKGKK